MTNKEMSFAEFHIKEMEVIGQSPTETKKYEMVGRNVKNPHLEYLVIQLSLPEAKRISLDTFFEDRDHVACNNKNKDAGDKRKVEEVIRWLSKEICLTVHQMPLAESGFYLTT